MWRWPTVTQWRRSMSGDREGRGAGLSDAGRVCLEGILRYAAAGAELFWRRAGCVGGERDGSRLYVANMGSDAVAVIDTKKLTAAAAKQGMVEPVGFIPTEWMPMSWRCENGTGGRRTLYVATDKGQGDGAEQLCAEGSGGNGRCAGRAASRYIATLLYGSLAAIDVASGGPEGGDCRGDGVEPDEGGAGEDCVCGR